MAETWIRPITPRVLAETLRIANAAGQVNLVTLQKCLSVETRRASEIARQLVAMALLREFDGDSLAITDTGIQLARAIANNNHDMMHQILMHYPPYRTTCRLLENNALTIRQIVDDSSMNEVAAETILHLIEWATTRLRRSRKHSFYLTQPDSPGLDSYTERLQTIWQKMSNSELGVRREFVRIPDLRDSICEALRIDNDMFDNLFVKVLETFPNKFELSSAPAPVTYASKEKGIRVSGRCFFYVRMLERR